LLPYCDLSEGDLSVPISWQNIGPNGSKRLPKQAGM
jgi:hypothetical protein